MTEVAGACAFPADDDFAVDPRRIDDQRWMAVALGLARRGVGRTAPNPAVGAVIVKDGVPVGRGWTQPGGRPHAEAVALALAGDAARGATLYVTLEPCSHFGKTPPCADAVVNAGVARVVAAIGDPDPRVHGRGFGRLRDAGIEVATGVGADAAARLTAGHVVRVTTGRPHVTLKLAVSADGKGGLAGRRPVAITGEASRRRVHLMRAESDAIMVGIGTVLADDPALTCRLPGMADRSPVRVVVDSALRLPATCSLVQTARQTPVWAVCAEDAPEAAETRLREAGVEVIRTARGADGRLALDVALAALGGRGVTRLMVEGGPTLAAALVSGRHVDVAMLLYGPAEIGPDGVDALEGLPLSSVTGSAGFGQTAQAQVGDDRWVRYERTAPGRLGCDLDDD